MQESQDNKEVTKKINKLFEQAQKLENVVNALKSNEGKLIVERVNQWLQVKNMNLQNIALKPLSADDHFEYSKSDLQNMKIVRSQITVLEELIGQLNPEVLEKQVNKLRKDAFDLTDNPEALLKKLVY